MEVFGVFLIMNLFVAVLSDGFGFDPDAEAAIGGVSSTEESGHQLTDHFLSRSSFQQDPTCVRLHVDRSPCTRFGRGTTRVRTDSTQANHLFWSHP